jgi:hypothetical protein
MRFPVGAFVYLKSGSPILEVMSTPTEYGRINLRYWNYDDGSIMNMWDVSEMCFCLWRREPLIIIADD